LQHILLDVLPQEAVRASQSGRTLWVGKLFAYDIDLPEGSLKLQGLTERKFRLA
jgi:hypothetical protein